MYTVPIKQEISVEMSTSTVVDMINKYSDQFGVNTKTLDSVVRCESNYNVTAVGDNGLAYGPAQFHKSTFDLFAKEYGKELDYKNPSDQIELMAWAFSKGYSKHWSCMAKVLTF